MPWNDPAMDDYGLALVKDIVGREIELCEGGRVMITYEAGVGPTFNYVAPHAANKKPATPEVILLFRRTLAAIEESDQLRAHLERTQGVSPDQDWKTGWGAAPKPKPSGGTR